MPNYRTHDRAALIAAPVIFISTYALTDVTSAAITVSTFLVSNYYLSPDLDIDSIMNRRWGILYFMWYPYKKLFHHRSLWTHSGPLSATIRFLYLLLWIIPIILLLQPTIPIAVYIYSMLFLYIGMILADSLHSVLDRVL